MVAVHISKHSLFRLKITIDCRLCTCPSIHFSLEITVGCLVCGGMCVWCVVKLGTLSLSCTLSFLFSFPFAFPLFFSLIFIFLSSFSFSFSLALALVLSLFLLSSLLATEHYGKNRSTNTVANIEAFECDLAQGKCTAVGSLPPPLPSLLPSHPLLFSKKEDTFHYRNISGEGIILHYSFISIQKNRRR